MKHQLRLMATTAVLALGLTLPGLAGDAVKRSPRRVTGAASLCSPSGGFGFGFVPGHPTGIRPAARHAPFLATRPGIMARGPLASWQPCAANR